MKRKAIISIINTDDNTRDPVNFSCTDKSLKLRQFNFLKVGKPRYHWWTKGIEEYWEFLTNSQYKQWQGLKFDESNPLHITALEFGATAGWGLGKRELSEEQFISVMQEEE